MTFQERFYAARKAHFRVVVAEIARQQGYSHWRIWFTRKGIPLPKTIKMWNDEG